MRVLLIVSILFFSAAFSKPEVHPRGVASPSDYLNGIKEELTQKWPGNRTINLVFHGHSVPAGYFKTPEVNTLDSYPFQVLRKLKEKYPYAVINVINTSIGGESSESGQKRFEKDVLTHKPDVLFIDYALNDRRVGLIESRKAWEKMIKRAKRDGIKIILLTPSPDLGVNISTPDNELEQHANQIRELAEEYNIGLADSYSRFRQLNANCNCLGEYMSQINHPNEKGHLIIASEVIRYF